MILRHPCMGKLILGTLFFVSSATVLLSADGMTQYENSELGVAVYYPTDWAMEEEQGISVVFSSDADFKDAEKDTGAGFGLMVLPSEFTENPELGAIWEAVMKDIDMQTDEPQSINMSGATGLYGTINEEEKDMAGVIYIFKAGSKVYMLLTIIHPASELEDMYKPVLMDMIETLEFMP
ncbi:MAG TPA: hypothetical protein VMX75_00535 [Spirochaetia bacterium]|nr:hypothetical protein [Spirochaetia bacterium]